MIFKLNLCDWINAGQMLRFIIVGTLTAIIYAGSLAIILTIHFISPSISSARAYLVANIFNYTMHHRWTFKTDRSHGSGFPRYILSIFPIYALLVLGTEFLPRIPNISFILFQIIFFILVMIFNFLDSTSAAV